MMPGVIQAVRPERSVEENPHNRFYRPGRDGTKAGRGDFYRSLIPTGLATILSNGLSTNRHLSVNIPGKRETNLARLNDVSRAGPHE